ncbi:excisionase family DNA-binding protein [Mycobacteroides abscessus]|uniref:excisionase family DNA-binding protein n=1 Tax=Mycobacteroides abscessus TaxID=36809 RepID=UPI0005E5F815|nr:excisionase family DNA-binding protein [Mycobacteroides abscessus]CPR69647.1 DNA binding domain-containing protein [Mycobacteroides abscessus]CPU70576.1 DNA binding domain-containing protein [Mycobacteroides abscessus]
MTTYIGTTTVAEELDCTSETVRTMILDGRLPAVRFGRRYKVAREALDAFKAAAVVRA